jgi:hypothetical protein
MASAVELGEADSRHKQQDSVVGIKVQRPPRSGEDMILGALRILFQIAARILADRLLQLLLLGVVGAALLFAFVLDADASIVFGVLVIGCVTAFVESAHHRRKK